MQFTIISCCHDFAQQLHLFFLWLLSSGRVFTDPGLPELSPQQRKPIYEEFVRVMALLHSTDWKQIGLQGYGREENYYARQVQKALNI